MSLQVQKSIIATFANVAWRPKIERFELEGQIDEGIELSSGKKMCACVNLVVAMAEIEIPDKKGFWKQTPNLHKLKGYVELKSLRNAQQAEELAPSLTAVTRSLFGDEKSLTPRAKHVTRAEALEMRQAPSFLKVNLAEGVDVFIKRPVRRDDNIIIKADEECIKNAIEFIVSKGVTLEELTAKRKYRAKTDTGVYTFGRYHYEKCEGRYIRSNKKKDKRRKCARVPKTDHGSEEENVQVEPCDGTDESALSQDSDESADVSSLPSAT
jgi:hypothetical protein